MQRCWMLCPRPAAILIDLTIRFHTEVQRQACLILAVANLLIMLTILNCLLGITSAQRGTSMPSIPAPEFPPRDTLDVPAGVTPDAMSRDRSRSPARRDAPMEEPLSEEFKAFVGGISWHISDRELKDSELFSLAAHTRMLRHECRLMGPVWAVSRWPRARPGAWQRTVEHVHDRPRCQSG